MDMSLKKSIQEIIPQRINLNYKFAVQLNAIAYVLG